MGYIRQARPRRRESEGCVCPFPLGHPTLVGTLLVATYPRALLSPSGVLVGDTVQASFPGMVM